MFECFYVRVDTLYARVCSCVCAHYLKHWEHAWFDTCVKYFFSVELAMTENLRGLSDKYETLENTLGMF